MLGHSRGLLNTTTATDAQARLDELTKLAAAVEQTELERIAATCAREGTFPLHIGGVGYMCATPVGRCLIVHMMLALPSCYLPTATFPWRKCDSR